MNDLPNKPPVDLLPPGAVVAVTCALTWGTLQVAGPVLLGDGTKGLEGFVSRVLVLTGLVAALVGFLTWPAVAAVLMATARVLWNREYEFRPFLAGAGWCHLPLLLSAAVIFCLLVRNPPSSAVDLEDLRWLSVAGTGCHAVLLAGLVHRRLQLKIWKAAVTVAAPWAVYRLLAWAMVWLLLQRG